MLYSCLSTNENTLPNPEIKDGIARLSGKITNYHPLGGVEKPTLRLSFLHPVTAETYRVTTTMNKDGAFSFEVPMQCDYTIGYLSPEMNDYEGFVVCLTSGKETKIDIIYDKLRRFTITNQTDSLGLTSTDLININNVCEKIMNYRSPGLTGYAKTPQDFAKRARISLNNRLKKIEENDVLSETAKNFVANYIKIFTLDGRLFLYREMMRIDYLNAGNKDVENFNPPDPDKKYYSFLKDFDLNIRSIYFKEIILKCYK